MREQTLEPESLSSKVENDHEDYINVKEVGHLSEMAMNLEPQSLSRTSKAKLLTDQSRKNLNENLNLDSAKSSGRDQHLESDINNLLSDRENTGFLAGALNLHSEDRPKAVSPLALTKIHFNDNEQALRQKYFEEAVKE